MRTKKGTVTSAKMDKTVTVSVGRLVMHSKYRKRFPVSKKFLADTDGHDVKEGDVVLIGETRPVSKRKYFKVVEILESAAGFGEVSMEEELKEVGGKEKEEASNDTDSSSSTS